MDIINLAPNPSAEYNIDGWGPGLASNVVDRHFLAWSGGDSVHAMSDAAAGAAVLTVPGLTPGETYTASMRVYVFPGNPPVTATAYFNTNGQTSTLTDQWEELTVVFIAGSDTEKVGILTEAGGTAAVDALIVTAGTTPQPYFDGDFPDTPDRVYSWTGTPGRSASLSQARRATPVAQTTRDTRRARCLIEVVDSTGHTRTLDGITDARIGWDQTRAPRVNLTVSAAVPDEATVAALDPRFPVRVWVVAGFDGDLIAMADLGLRRRGVARPADRHDVTAASDEALVIDEGDNYRTGILGTTSVRAAIQEQVDVIGGVTWDIEGSDTIDVSLDSDGVDRWSLVDDLADRDDLDVYDDGLRVWHIKPRVSTVAPTPDHTIAAGDTLLTYDDSIDRGGSAFYNRVQLRYQWRSDDGIEHTVVNAAEMTSGPFEAGPGSTVTYSETRDMPTTENAAGIAAYALMRRMVTRGRSFTVTAIANHRLRPDHTLRLVLPGGGTEDHLVESVEFDLIAGTMTVTLRIPDDTN